MTSEYERVQQNPLAGMGVQPRDEAEHKRMAWMMGQIEILLASRHPGARLTGACMSACWRMLREFSNRELATVFDRILTTRDDYILAQPISAVLLRDAADKVRREMKLRAQWSSCITAPDRLLPDEFDASEQGKLYRENLAAGMQPAEALREALRNGAGPLADPLDEVIKQAESAQA